MKAEEQKTLDHHPAHEHKPPHKGEGHGPSRGLVIFLVVVVVAVALLLVWRWLANRAAEYTANQMVALAQMTDGSDIRALAALAPDEKNIRTDIQTDNLRRQRVMVKQLEEFVRANPRSYEGRAARLRLARMALYLGEREAASQFPSHREAAKELLELARDQYKALEGEFAGTPLLVQEAKLNQARALETLGQFDEAKALYDDLAASPDKDSPPVVAAAKQAERLKAKLDTAKDLYDRTLGAKKNP